MVSCFADLRAEGHSPREAVVTGAPPWLRTVLMTALLAMLGLLPMAMSHSIGSEVQKPLAVVVIGGTGVGDAADASGVAGALLLGRATRGGRFICP